MSKLLERALVLEDALRTTTLPAQTHSLLAEATSNLLRTIRALQRAVSATACGVAEPTVEWEALEHSPLLAPLDFLSSRLSPLGAKPPSEQRFELERQMVAAGMERPFRALAAMEPTVPPKRRLVLRRTVSPLAAVRCAAPRGDARPSWWAVCRRERRLAAGLA